MVRARVGGRFPSLTEVVALDWLEDEAEGEGVVKESLAAWNVVQQRSRR